LSRLSPQNESISLRGKNFVIDFTEQVAAPWQ
jgi:hypothetical protein